MASASAADTAAWTFLFMPDLRWTPRGLVMQHAQQAMNDA
jgi:hypothetical protein